MNRPRRYLSIMAWLAIGAALLALSFCGPDHGGRWCDDPAAPALPDCR